MDDPMPITRDLALPLSEIALRASRSSGPGGQHANVTASRIEAVFDVAASATLAPWQKERIRARCGPRVTAVAQEARSQLRNRELALERLRERLAAALAVPRHRTPTRPTRASRRRRSEAKRRHSQRKQARRRPGGGWE
ncbi:alternative ribosome rescue aminoacyl-tRNA hydrolase ArfB [Conexibacter arvalis]|uniref:Ribosome-associated protein n=1 Tax=Conexibacter arvalis TaxID=912552 RepID=A0A840I8Q6_9ACTN|nr:alternative ribosome rescue aminoacyl-tRNA hydrolase ArfB [Conexibacter arvalis]MBB4660912.1 ribosome-associated protein [Conexibacter arvalis]